ncbi:hypothetical protein PVM13_33430 [Klebsiella variicola]|uniref:hypothetical protein n=1 Tax=Klebsiella variicola TaxID=244366 RepID=UPI0023795218|nr:hypothetical protein [Klebsiella variicola]MDD9253602.1 hypothetical protein [Klebsiella variicola]HDT2123496.1 hypothetical protein [Enterobacter roggenkampii]
MTNFKRYTLYKGMVIIDKVATGKTNFLNRIVKDHPDSILNLDSDFYFACKSSYLSAINEAEEKGKFIIMSGSYIGDTEKSELVNKGYLVFNSITQAMFYYSEHLSPESIARKEQQAIKQIMTGERITRKRNRL